LGRIEALINVRATSHELFLLPLKQLLSVDLLLSKLFLHLTLQFSNLLPFNSFNLKLKLGALSLFFFSCFLFGFDEESIVVTP